MNEALATKGSNALVLDSAEETLNKEVSSMERSAMALSIATDADYCEAAEFVKGVKQMQKQVTDYWEPMRASAHKAYQDVVSHKKEMLAPLESAEKILKDKMGKYSVQKEQERKAKEEEMRRLARQEMEKKLAEAAAAEAVGDSITAEFAMTEAEVLEDISYSGSVSSSAPKVKGVSTSKTWKIVGIDPTKVPVSVAGAVIRPVDEKAVMSLIKASKGTIEIPGVTYEETASISVRA